MKIQSPLLITSLMRFMTDNNADKDEQNSEELELVDEEYLDEKEKKLAKLKRELEACRKEKEEYLSGWQRAKADFINYKKDEERERENFVKFAGLGIFGEMLNVADSLEKAVTLNQDEGIKNTYAQLEGFLKKFGVNKIETAGQVFNPEIHEAVAEEEVLDRGMDNKIIAQSQAGYMIHDRVLRPARVKVGVYKK